MPMVEAQVKNQIPLHDLSNTSVSIAPADYSSWHEVRTELMGEAKAGLKARVEAELAAAADDNELKALRDRFAAEERAIEHQIDHEVHQFSCALEVEYNVRDDRSNPHTLPHLCSLADTRPPLACAVPLQVDVHPTSSAHMSCAPLPIPIGPLVPFPSSKWSA